MASAQCHKPSEQVLHTTCSEKTTKSEVTSQQNSHHHSFTDKMKEMANSARKVFHHQDQHHNGSNHGSNNGHHVSEHTKKPASSCSTGTGAGGVAHDGLKKNKVKKTEGHGGHCLPKMHKKKHKEEKHGYNSDSASSSESEKETSKKKGK